MNLESGKTSFDADSPLKIRRETTAELQKKEANRKVGLRKEGYERLGQQCIYLGGISPLSFRPFIKTICRLLGIITNRYESISALLRDIQFRSYDHFWDSVPEYLASMLGLKVKCTMAEIELMISRGEIAVKVTSPEADIDEASNGILITADSEFYYVCIFPGTHSLVILNEAQPIFPRQCSSIS